MKYELIHAEDLDANLVERWGIIQKNSPMYASPYFRPEFTQSVAEVRDDVYIGLLVDENRLVGFFPFHYKKNGLARPVGLGLSDYHGVIAESDAEWSVRELMHSCKISRWEFNHLPVEQKQFEAFHESVSESPIINVSQGFAEYESSRNKSGRKQLKETLRKACKMADQKGTIEFTLQTFDRQILDQMMEWKSKQCRNTGTMDYFSLEWCRNLIRKIHSTQEENFGGHLSCLHVSGTLAAVHFGIYSQNVWHSWFPAYNHELEEFSPGSILLLELIKAASEQQVRYIDLGKGVSLYKKRLMTSSIQVAEGCYTAPSLRNRIKHLQDIAEEWSKTSYLKPVLRIPGRIIKNRERKGRYE